MPILSKDHILAADDLVREKHTVPEWAPKDTPRKERGEFYVHIKTMTGLERDRYEAGLIAMSRGKDGSKKVKIELENIRAQLLWRTIVDDDGLTIFSSQEVVQLGLKSCAVLDRLWTVARRLNGLNQADVDFYVGNSMAEPSDSSASD